MDEARLAEFRELVGGRGCIVRHGYLAYAWGEYDQPHDVASALKPLYSYLLMQAVATGKLRSLDAPVAEYWQDQPAVRERSDHQDRDRGNRAFGLLVAAVKTAGGE